MKSLPIDVLRDEFRSALAHPDTPVVVEAPTGSGKSTRLPLWLESDLEGPVLVVEPRRVACRSLAQWLAQQRGEDVGASVGYHVRFDKKKSAQTKILFATPGIVLRLLKASEWPFAGVLLDEFHERSWELDLIVTILRARRAQKTLSGPLVVTSATLEATALVSALRARHLRSEGRTFPVTTQEEEGTHPPNAADLEQRLLKAMQNCLRRPGEVLVFLPGVREIENAQRALSSLAKEHEVELVPVHGRLPLKQLSNALQPSANARRVFLSTNVAETSVTLPGVRVVLDSGLVRRRIHRAGRSVLALVPVSRAEANQRSGRAGRVAPGHCIRLWGRQAPLQETTPPEIERIELDELVLAAAACDLPLREPLPWLTPPPTFAWDRAMARLQSWNAIDVEGVTTPLGRRFFSLPISVEEARFLVNAPEPLAGTLADLCAILQLRRAFLRGVSGMQKDKREEILEERKQLLHGFVDEVMTSLQLLRFGDARLHGLDRQVLEEARRLSRALRQALGLPSTENQPLPTAKALSDYLIRRIPDQVFVLRKRALQAKGKKKVRQTTQPWANEQGVELQVSPYAPPYETRDLPPPPVAGILFSHHWLSGHGLKIRGMGRFLLPCSLPQLVRAEAGECTVSEPIARKEGGEWKIRGQVQRILAGITLCNEEQPLEGEELRKAFVSLTMKGQCWTAVREQLLDTLHLAKVMRGWPEPREWTFPREWRSGLPEAPLWLLQRLEELGVESNEDLSLLELSDFRWPLLEDVTIDSWVLDALQEDFPRVWEYQGQRYHCEVEPGKRRVVMEPANELARRTKNLPASRLLPRFRGLAVDFRKASREFRWRE